MTFEQFVIWAVNHACVFVFGEESEADRIARQNAIMSKELSNAAGEDGDVHFMDLASVLSRGNSAELTNAAGQYGHGGSELQGVSKAGRGAWSRCAS